MNDRTLTEVRKKLVRLIRSDPPPPVMGLPREPLAPVFDRWMAKRFDADEVHALFRLELEYGERAMSDWFAEVLVEAGALCPQRIRT
ncbi:MAG: hypothetical protein IPO09_08595 [Anaeromyxobacter sp.]|nr:hypothetical protein [Anaeromyxobacter sp.]MBL0277700.1 hypothetical protein [Anaeromyxobacter sp.]